jgi:predicted AAA+ superfamily ATPase
MNEDEILNILVDWNIWGNFKEELVDRQAYIEKIKSLDSRKTATTLYGIRRSGKSSLAYLYIQGLIEEDKIKANDSLFLNFEDPRFSKITVDDLFKILETYMKSLSPGDPVIIMDEVQNVDNWENFVRYLIEAKKLRVLVTGSSSKLLGWEISTTLSGRHVNIEIFPLSFTEFLFFKGIKVKNQLDLVKQKIEISRLFDEYILYGGFPEVVSSQSTRRKEELLAMYYDDIMIKDIARRFKIKEIDKLENLAFLLLSNIASLQSFNRLKGKLNLSLDTVQRFTKYFEIARMFIFLKKFSFSSAEQVRSMNKVYTSDLGFFNTKGFQFIPNKGKIFENIAAIELNRRAQLNKNTEIYYWQNPQNYEVDFVVKEGLKIEQLIQVCWNLGDEKTKKREIRALLHAAKELGCENLLILCDDKDTEEEVEWYGLKHRIKFKTLWKWLLEGMDERSPSV